MKKTWIIIVIAAVVVLALGGYWWWQKRAIAPQQPQISVPADWKTYQNRIFGFETKYPPAFKEIPVGFLPSFNSVDEYFGTYIVAYEKNKAHLKETEPWIDINNIFGGASKYFTDPNLSIPCRDSKQVSCFEAPAPLTVAGNPAYRVVYRGNPPVDPPDVYTDVYIKERDWVVEFECQTLNFAPGNGCDKIIQTFKLAPSLIPTDWGTYKDLNLGFGLEYPPTWQICSSPEGVFEMTGDASQPCFNGEKRPPIDDIIIAGGKNTSEISRKYPDYQSLKSAVFSALANPSTIPEDIKKEIDSSSATYSAFSGFNQLFGYKNAKEIDLNGTPALQMIWDPTDESTWYAFFYNSDGKVLEINYFFASGSASKRDEGEKIISTIVAE